MSSTDLTTISSGNETLDADLERLRAQGHEVELLVNGTEVGILVRAVPLPDGWDRERVDVLLRTTTVYPGSEMDMVWVEPDLLLADGRQPQSSSQETHFGRTWLRFSWHRNSPWKPGRDDLISHFEFARERFSRIE